MLDDTVAWSATQLLVEAQRRIAKVRDELPVARSGIRVLRRLNRIRGAFLRDSMDTRTVADEFEDFAKEMKRSRWLASAAWESKEPNFEWTLRDNVKTDLLVRAGVLAASEQRLRDAVETETNIISAIANLRAQLLLGLAAIVVTVLVAVHPNLHHAVRPLHLSL
jgi:hypothetical protein